MRCFAGVDARPVKPLSYLGYPLYHIIFHAGVSRAFLAGLLADVTLANHDRDPGIAMLRPYDDGLC